MKSSPEKTLGKFLKAAPVNWPKMADKLSPSEMYDISRVADSQIQRLTYLGEYLYVRSLGNTTHAVKRAQRKTAKVRKAMGYTYPKEGLANMSI